MMLGTKHFIFRGRLIQRIKASGLHTLSLTVAFFVFVLPGLCLAELYMYKDKDGLTHFTDNLADVPEDQRSQVTRLPETKSPVVPKAESVEEQQPAVSQEAEAAAPEPVPEPNQEKKDPAVLESLKATKERLDKERRQLEREQDGLLQKVQEMRIESNIRVVNRDLMALHERMVQHQQAREAFERDWEAFHGPPPDDSDTRALKDLRASFEKERGDLDREQAALFERGKYIRTDYASRAYKVRMRELRDRIVAFRAQRDAFEKAWEAVYSLP
jgi:hypothetical protein